MVPRKEKTDPRLVLSAEVAKLIDLSEDQQLTFVRCVRDAVTLAGEQMQDVRLGLLEDPPPARTSPFLVDVFLSLALGPLAGAVVGQVAKASVTAILRSHATTLSLAGATLTRVTITEGTLGAAFTVASASTITKSFLQRESDAQKIWTGVTAAVLNQTVQSGRSYLPAVLKATDHPVDLLADSASVAVRRASLAFSRTHELAIEASHREMRRQVDAEELSDRALWDLKIRLAMDTHDTSKAGAADAALERRMSLLFEASMWAIHFQDMKLISPGDPARAPIDDKFRPILSYLVRRFPHHEHQETSFEGYYAALAKKGMAPIFGRRAGYVYSPADFVDEFGVRTGGPATFDEGELSFFERAVQDLQRWFTSLAVAGDPTGNLLRRGYVNVGAVFPKVVKPK